MEVIILDDLVWEGTADMEKVREIWEALPEHLSGEVGMLPYHEGVDLYAELMKGKEGQRLMGYNAFRFDEDIEDTSEPPEPHEEDEGPDPDAEREYRWEREMGFL